MRLCGALLIALGACYGPSYAPGAPCDPVINNCPTGLECLPDGSGHSCGGTGTTIDAVETPDAPDEPDTDGDGITNRTDNCAAIANSNQHDEDGDAVGDVCDLCPVSATNTDSDGDGVGDGCDPRPMTGGDTFVLFEPFAQGIPQGWNIGAGAWTVGNDDLRIVSGVGLTNGLRTNVPATPRMMAVASVVPEAVFGTAPTIGITNPYASALGGGGILCSLSQPAAGGRVLSLFDLATNAEIDSHSLAWVESVPYILAAVRYDTIYQCSNVSGMMGTPAQGTTATTVIAPMIGLRSSGVTARFQWLMIVQIGN